MNVTKCNNCKTRYNKNNLYECDCCDKKYCNKCINIVTNTPETMEFDFHMCEHCLKENDPYYKGVKFNCKSKEQNKNVYK